MKIGNPNGSLSFGNGSLSRFGSVAVHGLIPGECGCSILSQEGSCYVCGDGPKA